MESRLNELATAGGVGESVRYRGGEEEYSVRPRSARQKVIFVLRYLY